LAQQQTTPVGFWAWEPAGQTARILMDLELVDRMSAMFLDGYGSVPKRGAEVGGVLVGSRERIDGKLQVTIVDCIPVPCSHRFGPSYVLSDEDLTAFSASVKFAQDAVGYYRSHTRDGLSLSSDDLQYCQTFFPGPDDIVMLVRPSAMKVSTAGFFCYAEGSLQDATPLEFPFRRSELETGEAPERRPLGEKRPDPPPPATPPPSQQTKPQQPPQAAPPPREPRKHGLEGILGIQDAVAARDPSAATPPPSHGAARPTGAGLPSLRTQPHPQLPELNYPFPPGAPGKLRRNWVWYPLSFIFLLLGVLLGFQAALVFSSGKPASQDPYTLGLGVERRGEELSVRWDRSNGAVRTASKGVLEITDGRYSKRVDLDSSQLQTGSVIYRFSNSDVKFKLEVYPKDRVVISETIDWKNS
jgi:hypothetical protein